MRTGGFHTSAGPKRCRGDAYHEDVLELFPEVTESSRDGTSAFGTAKPITEKEIRGEKLQAKKRRVGIVCPYGYFDTIPSLCNAAIILSQEGYSVVVFTPQNPAFRVPTFPGHAITIRFWGLGSFFLPHARRLLSRLVSLFIVCGCRGAVANGGHEKPEDPNGPSGRKTAFQVLHEHVEWLLRMLRRYRRLGRKAYDALLRPLIEKAIVFFNSVRVWRDHHKAPYVCLIGVDPQGLQRAHQLAKWIHTPIIYYSLELLLSSENTHRNLERMKQREVALSRRSPFVVIQDCERARLLGKDNEIAMERFVLVPNAPLGEARRSPSYYWHRKLGLPPDRRIVLHAGSVIKCTAIEEIVTSVPSWPENWVLVIHTRGDTQASQGLSELREMATPNRVYFSLRAVPRQEYDLLVDGADIGIGFYVGMPGSTWTQTNIEAVGYSSGKIAYSLHAGLPVITNNCGLLSELIEREGCGVAVPSSTEIAQAITQISGDYKGYSNRACRVFNTHFEYGKHFEQVLRQIASLDGDAA